MGDREDHNHTLSKKNVKFAPESIRHMKKTIFLIAVLFLMYGQASAQGYYFGVKGGLSIGVQSWNGFERDPLMAYHGIAFIESLSEGNRFSLFAQAGYHQRGSAFRNQFFGNVFNGGYTRAPATKFIFNNASVLLGGKQKYDFAGDTKVYYLFGIRGEYTVSTNLGKYEEFNELNPGFAIYPFNTYEFIRRINYGITVGGGFEVALSEFVGGLVEFTVNPDFSDQYRQPPVPNVTDPYSGELRTVPERRIRNLTFEVTLGLRFLRKVIYIED